MNLIDEEDGPLTRSAQPVRRRRHDSSHFRDIALHAAQPHKFRLRHRRDDLRERRLSRARRAGQDDRGQPIRLDRASQEFAGRENMLLPDELFERTRPDAAGERCSGDGGLGFHLRVGEEVLHREE